MATSKEKKNKVLDEVREILKQNKNIVLTEYRGLNVEQISELRAKLRKVGIRYKVLKNTLSKRLFHEVGIGQLDDQLHGPVAVGFLSTDLTGSTKALLNFSKQNELFKIKAGYIDGQVLNVDGVKAIASLPSREVLLSMLMSTMQAPIKQWMTVVQGTTQKLVYALNALKEQKSKAAA